MYCVSIKMYTNDILIIFGNVRQHFSSAYTPTGYVYHSHDLQPYISIYIYMPLTYCNRQHSITSVISTETHDVNNCVVI